MTGGVVGILLAGGLARRMGGGDKCLRSLGGRTILSRIVETMHPQVAALALNANGDADRFAEYGLPVIGDSILGNVGPLAGVLSGMEWAAEYRPNCPWIATVPTDAPFLPADLVDCLRAAIRVSKKDMACAASAGRQHPVCGLWPVRLRHDLRAAIVDEEIRKVDTWTGRYSLSIVEFSEEPHDPFFNTNRPEDLSQAEAMLSRVEQREDLLGREQVGG